MKIIIEVVGLTVCDSTQELLAQVAYGARKYRFMTIIHEKTKYIAVNNDYVVYGGKVNFSLTYITQNYFDFIFAIIIIYSQLRNALLCCVSCGYLYCAIVFFV